MADINDFDIDENESVTIIRDEAKGMEIKVNRNSLNGFVAVHFEPISAEGD